MMSLLELPDVILEKIFSCIMAPVDDNLPGLFDYYSDYFHNYLALASTCKRLAKIGVGRLKKSSRYYDINPHKYDYDKPGQTINIHIKHNLKWRRENPCPIHSTKDEQCYYEQLTPLIKAKWIYLSTIRFLRVDFMLGKCIFTADGLKWDRITKLVLDSCDIDLETFSKLLSRLENVVYLGLMSNEIKIRGVSLRETASVRRALEEISFVADEESILLKRCIDLPAKNVIIDFSGVRPTRLPTSYLHRYKQTIESLEVILYRADVNIGVEFGRQLANEGLQNLRFNVRRRGVSFQITINDSSSDDSLTGHTFNTLFQPSE